MKTKASIVQKLLDKDQITAEEAVILLEQVVNIPSQWAQDLYEPSKPKTYGDICPCNPKNGGSGVCGCVIGHKIIDNNPTITTTETNWTTHYTFKENKD